MTIRLPASLLLLFALVASGRAAASFPLQDGEHLSYRVSWAVVRGAGSIKIDARRDAAREDRLVVTTTTATRGFARLLFSFDAKAESVYDLNSGRVLGLQEFSRSADKEKEHRVSFDHTARTTAYSDRASKEPAILPMPDGDPSDMILALLHTRTWNLKPGESRDALVLFGNDFYELTIHATRYEEVWTSLGKFNTVVLEPRMEKTPPKGMFKRGSSARVWISQGEQPLPVRFEVEFKIGTGTATLDYYEKPTADRGATPARPAVSAPATNGAAPATNAKNPGP